MRHIKDFEDFKVDISEDEPVYVISVVSRLCNIPAWTLRKLDELGVVKPKRMGKKTRCYSVKQIKRLEYIHYLMEDEHVNISGVKMILELETKE